MQKTKLLNIIMGVVSLIFFAVLIINFSNLVMFLTDFGETYLSRDNNFGSKTILMIKIFSVIGVLFTGTISIIFFLNKTKIIYIKILTFFQVSDSFSYKLCRKKHLDLFILIIAVLLGIYQIYYLLTFGETHDKIAIPLTLAEGSLEKYYAFLLLFSIFLLIISILRINKKHFLSKLRRKIYLLIIMISVIIIPILGEEISWGQQIFHWESIGVFNDYNLQNETNVHNFLPPSLLVRYIYPIVGSCSFLILFLMWIIPKNRNSYLFNLFFPHPSLFFLTLIMMVVSFFGGGGETFEQLFAIFVFLYSFRVFMCLTFPNVDLLPKN